MSVSQEQLGEIHRQLREVFLSHPAISIKPAKGDPPEQYEITYNIAGFSKPGRGEATLSTGHKVELTIPFGFPHFPPSCKPKSDIYHPDFDPAAICLGDFWQQHSQIPDLIIFIGKLINGESYSTTNAFNEEAAIWYQSHKDVFPITEIQWQDSQENESITSKDATTQIDTIDDADLSPDFNLLSLDDSLPEEDLALNTSFPVIETPSGADIGLLQLLENQKKFFKLRQTLGKSATFSDQMEKISNHTEEEIKKSEEVFRDAKKAENLGNLKKAARLYEQVGAIATDFPNLEADQKRVIQSLKLLDKVNQAPTADPANFDFSDQLEDILPVPDLSAKVIGKRKRLTVSNKQRDSFVGKKALGSKLLFSLAAGILCILLSTGGLYYFIAVQHLDAAQVALNQCTAGIDNAQFDGAKRSCDDALEKLSSVKFILQYRVKKLQNDITEILGSEKLSQGLAGKTFVDGKYLTKKDAATVFTYKQLLKEGEDFFDQEDWTQAEDRYVKITTITDKSTLFSEAAVDEIKSKLNFIRFSLVFSSANTLLSKQKWQEAAAEIKKAETLLGALPEKDKHRYALELSSALVKCNFEEFRKQGDDFFSKADWLNAISSYKSVLPTEEDAKVAPQDTLATLRENISRAELYATIDMGNKAFISGAWDEAIQEYNKAGSILTANQGSMNLADTQLTRKKIDRIILQTTIIRDRQAAKTLQDDKKDLPAARNTYRRMVANITNSSFAAEPEFLETRKTSIATIQELDEKIYKAEKEQYLKESFRTLFVANYPTAIPENLNNPIITYIKEADGKMIFKMQCTETGQGRPLALVMFYAYDKGSNRWDFFSEKQ